MSAVSCGSGRRFCRSCLDSVPSRGFSWALRASLALLHVHRSPAGCWASPEVWGSAGPGDSTPDSVGVSHRLVWIQESGKSRPFLIEILQTPIAEGAEGARGEMFSLHLPQGHEERPGEGAVWGASPLPCHLSPSHLSPRHLPACTGPCDPTCSLALVDREEALRECRVLAPGP